MHKPRIGAIIAIASLSLAALVGCSSSDDDSGSSSGAAPSGTTAFPVSVESRLGTAEIDKKPERVVTLGVPDLDVATALGVVPVGAVQVMPWPWEGSLGEDTQKLAYSPDGVNLEEIAALEPDVILATGLGGLDAQYDQLKQIAPVVGDIDGVLTTDWRDTTKAIGKALGEDAKTQDLVTSVEKKISDTKAANPNIAGKTYATGNAYQAGVLSVEVTDQTPMGRIFAELGLKLAPELKSAKLDDSADSSKVGAGTEELSLEKLSDKLGGAQFLSIGYADGTEDSITGSPLFQRLPAVEKGAYVSSDSATYTALALPTVTSIPFGIDKISPALATLNDQ